MQENSRRAPRFVRAKLGNFQLFRQAITFDKAKRVGIIMAQLFKAASEIEVDVYRITRIEREEERPERYDWKPRKYYVFELMEGQ